MSLTGRWSALEGHLLVRRMSWPRLRGLSAPLECTEVRKPGGVCGKEQLTVI